MSEQRDLRSLIREASGKNRCDLTLLLHDSQAFREVVARLAEPFRNEAIDRVAAIDAMGFALGGAVAGELNAGLVLIRKRHMVAWQTSAISFIDYTGNEKGLEVASDAIVVGDRILVVDDWAETGEQLHATIRLVEAAGGQVAGVAMVNMDPPVRADRRFTAYHLHALLEYG